MRQALILALLLTIPVLPACDGEDADACQAPSSLELVAPPDFEPLDIAFREVGPPQGLYITKINGAAIKRAQFVAMIETCAKQVDPPVTLTLSWYQPDTSKPERVLGLGESMMASPALFECYRQAFLAQKPVAF